MSDKKQVPQAGSATDYPSVDDVPPYSGTKGTTTLGEDPPHGLYEPSRIAILEAENRKLTLQLSTMVNIAIGFTMHHVSNFTMNTFPVYPGDIEQFALLHNVTSTIDDKGVQTITVTEK